MHTYIICATGFSLDRRMPYFNWSVAYIQPSLAVGWYRGKKKGESNLRRLEHRTCSCAKSIIECRISQTSSFFLTWTKFWYLINFRIDLIRSTCAAASPCNRSKASIFLLEQCTQSPFCCLGFWLKKFPLTFPYCLIRRGTKELWLMHYFQ